MLSGRTFRRPDQPHGPFNHLLPETRTKKAASLHEHAGNSMDRVAEQVPDVTMGRQCSQPWLPSHRRLSMAARYSVPNLDELPQRVLPESSRLSIHRNITSQSSGSGSSNLVTLKQETPAAHHAHQPRTLIPTVYNNPTVQHTPNRISKPKTLHSLSSLWPGPLIRIPSKLRSFRKYWGQSRRSSLDSFFADDDHVSINASTSPSSSTNWGGSRHSSPLTSASGTTPAGKTYPSEAACHTRPCSMETPAIRRRPLPNRALTTSPPPCLPDLIGSRALGTDYMEEYDFLKANSQGRCLSPSESDYQNLGGYKFGTLRITNDLPRPATAPQGKSVGSWPTGSAKAYSEMNIVGRDATVMDNSFKVAPNIKVDPLAGPLQPGHALCSTRRNSQRNIPKLTTNPISTNSSLKSSKLVQNTEGVSSFNAPVNSSPQITIKSDAGDHPIGQHSNTVKNRDTLCHLTNSPVSYLTGMPNFSQPATPKSTSSVPFASPQLQRQADVSPKNIKKQIKSERRMSESVLHSLKKTVKSPALIGRMDTGDHFIVLPRIPYLKKSKKDTKQSANITQNRDAQDIPSMHADLKSQLRRPSSDSSSRGKHAESMFTSEDVGETRRFQIAGSLRTPLSEPATPPSETMAQACGCQKGSPPSSPEYQKQRWADQRLKAHHENAKTFVEFVGTEPTIQPVVQRETVNIDRPPTSTSFRGVFVDNSGRIRYEQDEKDNNYMSKSEESTRTSILASTADLSALSPAVEKPQAACSLQSTSVALANSTSKAGQNVLEHLHYARIYCTISGKSWLQEQGIDHHCLAV
ncbi:hypothetical protein QQS21_006459 [Conoideocrella luteorostrata]|uniref:Uncharacterized protein n=1 Tax=Conoideocrella luteorostrata TaxID=1105319 RepID=A0AAJ0FXZ2_9HYPO|nr:hypothetical protein QQS21_006459 [Conoideocrella luteorostrata]